MLGNTGNNDQNRKATSTRNNDMNIPEIIIVTISVVEQIF